MNNTTTKTQKEPIHYSTMNQNTWVFDPGKTTGVAKFLGRKLIWWGELDGWKTLAEDGWKTLAEKIWEGDRVIYESVHWRGVAFNPIGIEVIGDRSYQISLLYKQYRTH